VLQNATGEKWIFCQPSRGSMRLNYRRTVEEAEMGAPIYRKLPWWGWSLIAAGVLTLFGWMAWVKLPEVAVLGTDAGFSPKRSLKITERTVPRATKEMFVSCEKLIIPTRNYWETTLRSLINQANNDQKQCEKLINSLGSDINITDDEHRTYLWWAARLNAVNVCRFLIDAGADFNICDVKSVSPLKTAMDHGNPEIVKMLIYAGAEVDLSDTAFRRLLLKCCYRHQKGIIEILIEYNEKNNADSKLDGTVLLMAAYLNDASIVKLLIDHGVDVNFRKKYYDVPPTAPSSRGMCPEKIINYLESKMHPGYTAMHYAAVNSFKEGYNVVEILIQNNADVNSRAEDGKTPLDLANINDSKHIPIYIFLREHGGKTGKVLDVQAKWALEHGNE